MSEDQEFAVKLEPLARQGAEYSKTAKKLDPNDPLIARLIAEGIKLQEESRIALQEAGKAQLACLRCGGHVDNNTDFCFLIQSSQSWCPSTPSRKGATKTVSSPSITREVPRSRSSPLL